MYLQNMIGAKSTSNQERLCWCCKCASFCDAQMCILDVFGVR